MRKFIPKCPFCYGGMTIQEIVCKKCNVTMKGDFSIPRIARLSVEEQEFIEEFVLVGGSLKELGARMRISYPTVRARLDRIIRSLESLRDEIDEREQNILNAIESGKIPAKEGARLIKELDERYEIRS